MFKECLITFFLVIFLFNFSFAQRPQVKRQKAKTEISHSKPKLVVGIVVDQMRYDYLTRFENKYGRRRI